MGKMKKPGNNNQISSIDFFWYQSLKLKLWIHTIATFLFQRLFFSNDPLCQYFAASGATETAAAYSIVGGKVFYVSVVVASVEGLVELHEVYPEIVVRHPSISGSQNYTQNWSKQLMSWSTKAWKTLRFDSFHSAFRFCGFCLVFLHFLREHPATCLANGSVEESVGVRLRKLEQGGLTVWHQFIILWWTWMCWGVSRS